MPGDVLTIRGGTVEARSPEGTRASVGVAEFLESVAPPLMSTCGLVMPEGVRMIFSTRSTTILVWELPPQVHCVRWIRDDSPVPYHMPGLQVTYADRRLALPYLVIVAVFARGRTGKLVLTSRNEAYFRTDPLGDEDDALLFPALLNISKFKEHEAARRPLAWICTQNTNLPGLAREPDVNRRIRKSLLALKRTMLEAAFNYSSEHHELTSYWSLSAESIPEVASLDRWEKLSRTDPLFVLKVPWLPAEWNGRPVTVRTLVERIGSLSGPADRPLESAGDLISFVFNGARRRRTDKGAST